MNYTSEERELLRKILCGYSLARVAADTGRPQAHVLKRVRAMLQDLAGSAPTAACDDAKGAERSRS